MTKFTPPPRGPSLSPPGAKPSDGGDNALWRIATWFPQLTDPVLKLLKGYHSEILKFNSKINLISRNTEREADSEHFADCILAADILFKQTFNSTIYDIGSGNGFPGIVFAILSPGTRFDLVESDMRKCEFLKHAVSTLGLQNVRVLNVRFETLMDSGIQVAVSRGLASISKTLLNANKVFSKEGRYFHLKGKNWSSEIAELPSQLISVWNPHLLGEYSLPISQARRALVMTQKKQ